MMDKTPNIFRRRLRKVTTYALMPFRSLYAYARQPVPPVSRKDEEYADFLNGQRVAIVGPAPTVIGSRMGKQIDSYDRVVRLNHALPIPSELTADVGKRTDILYHNLWQKHPKAPAFEQLVPTLVESVQWVCAASPYVHLKINHVKNIDDFTAVLGDRLPFRTVVPRKFLTLGWRLRSTPNAGMGAIQDLLSFDIDELYIFGFTFYQTQTPHYDGYKGMPASKKVHNQQRQMRQMRRWVLRDQRINLDDSVRQILFPQAEK